MSLFIPASVIAATMPGAGPHHAKHTEAIPNIAMFGTMIHDEGPGTVRRNPFGREPIVTYRMSARDQVAMRRGIRLNAETFFAAGAKEVYLPILGASSLDADGSVLPTSLGVNPQLTIMAMATRIAVKLRDGFRQPVGSRA